MPDRRGARFVVEALFLIALAAALALARLDVLEIVGVMALGWLVVAVLEWAAWRGEPHYGSGLPPRYYVPGVNLPPPQPLEQVERGYPDASREEAPTWIASAALRAEVLGEWPMAAPVELEPGDEDEELEPEFVDSSAKDADPWTVAELPVAPVEEAQDEPVPALVAPRSPRTTPAVEGEPGTAWYTLDPLAEAAPRRRFRRGAALAEPAGIRVRSRPQGARALPGSLLHTTEPRPSG